MFRHSLARFLTLVGIYAGKNFLLFAMFVLFYFSKIFEGVPDLIVSFIQDKSRPYQSGLGEWKGIYQSLKEFGFTFDFMMEFFCFIIVNLSLLFLCFLLLSWIGKVVARAFNIAETEGHLLCIIAGCITLLAYDQVVFRSVYQDSIFFILSFSLLGFLTWRAWKFSASSYAIHRIEKMLLGMLLFCVSLPLFFSLSIVKIPFYFRGYSIFFFLLFFSVLFLVRYRFPSVENRSCGMSVSALALLCLALIFLPPSLKKNIAYFLMLIISIFYVGACILAFAKMRHLFRRWMLLPAIAICLVFVPWDDCCDYFQRNQAGPGKNIIIVGVDDLSPDMLDRANEIGIVPIMKGLQDRGVQYSRAYTPLGRTSAAWASILSGDTPQEHGSYFNLRDLEKIKKDHLVSFKLREQGYKTIWALDERRFNYMDESFGFDQVIGPKTGLMEFLQKGITRFPLNNILLQYSFSKSIFPYAYENAGYGTSYHAKGFVRSILAATRNADKPVFLAVHFESAHYPWEVRPIQKVRGDVRLPHPAMRGMLEALTVVDRQIRDLMQGLERQGLLDDAMVIFLSDHGEGFYVVESRVAIGRSGRLIEIAGVGHGNELLSDHANRVVLTTLKFQDKKVVNVPENHDEQVSLQDVKGTIERYLEDGDIHVRAKDTCIIVETGNKIAGIGAKSIRKIITDSLPFYRLNQEKGHIHLRETNVQDLIASKDIGVRCKDRVTYFSTDYNGIVTFALDSSGIAKELAPSPIEDVARLSRYMAGYNLEASPQALDQSLIRNIRKETEIMDNR
jgi:hypothetical protein